MDPVSSPVDTIREALKGWIVDDEEQERVWAEAREALDVLVREAAAQQEAIREIEAKPYRAEEVIARLREREALAAGGGKQHVRAEDLSPEDSAAWNRLHDRIEANEKSRALGDWDQVVEEFGRGLAGGGTA